MSRLTASCRCHRLNEGVPLHGIPDLEIGHGQDNKGTALSRCALHSETPLVRFDDAVADSQP